MDKIEERYKKLKEELSRWKDKDFRIESLLTDFMHEMEEEHPNLLKNENERIADEIIQFLYLPHPQFVGKRDHEKWIAWLEKQGNLVKYYEDKLDKCACDNFNKGYKKALEKQGEPNPYSGVSFKYNGHTWGMCARDNGVEIGVDGELKAFLSLEKSFIFPKHPQSELTPKSAVEAIKEEKVDNENCVKPVDKAKTKFREGDWIIRSDSRLKSVPLKILKITPLDYKVVNIFGDNHTITESCVNEYYRLWTIQDAKDGDVLINWNNTIFIFKAIEDETVKFHIAYNEKWDAIKTPSTKLSHLGLPEPQFEFHPATKEQRDTLMKAMTDAGYFFDYDTKKLEKKLPKGEDYGIDGIYHAIRILKKTLGKVDGYQTDDGILEHKCAISAVEELTKNKDK